MAETIEQKIEKYDDRLVWAELKPRLWAGAMTVLALAALTMTGVGMMATSGFGIGYGIATIATFAGAAVSWYMKEKTEKQLEMLYSHVGQDVESDAQSKNWAKNLGLGPEQTQTPPQQQLDSQPQGITDNTPPPLTASQFVNPEAGRSDKKLWSELYPSKAEEKLVNKPQENFVSDVVQSKAAQTAEIIR
jgi:hypothetical protein